MAHSADALHHDDSATVKEIWKVTGILSLLTIVELILGFWMMGISSTGMIMTIKGSIVILMIAKAFYIVAYFMHLKHEVKNLIMTIVVPLALFIWFIIAFLYEGNSYKDLKNRYDPYKKQQTEIKVQKNEEVKESKKSAE